MVVQHLDTPMADHPRTAEAGFVVEPRWTCALVNNMPDGAFVQTEGQFLDLLDIGSGDEGLDVRLYTMAGVPRGEETTRRIADRYTPLSELFDHPPQMLIVTGANPVEQAIEDELFWTDLVNLLTWASKTIPSMLLSCLSAHAALKVFDGIDRHRLPSKCTGVFAQRADAAHALSAGLGSEIVLPHSRLNFVPTGQVRAAGYDVPLYSERSGWSVAGRRIDRSNVVLLQSHPEYGPTSLLREYQRDIRRYVRHERDELPVLPDHCAAPEDREQLETLHRRITTCERDPILVESFPFGDIEARAPWPWRSVATQLYTNWLANVPDRVS
jgi:homoserine O-succinyltransferase/O-acetyltransferase